MKDETIYELFTGGASNAATKESVSSQLPGRIDGPADAYRHILISAELTRRFPESYANILLNSKEMPTSTTPASAMDYHNNEIGIEIGKYVYNNGGDWNDVVRISQKVIQESLKGYSPNDLNNRFTKEDKGHLVSPMTISLENGKLLISGISVLDVSKWRKNPKVEDSELSNLQSNWPDFSGEWVLRFVKEPYNYLGQIFNYKPIKPISDFGNTSSSVSSILDDIRDAMNALKDPLIIDLKNDGLNLSNPDNRYIESIYFDLNNDGIKERTGWIIPKYEVINSADGISNGFITNNSFYFEGDKEQAQQGWNISYSNITYNGIKQLINPVIDDVFLAIDKIMPQNEAIKETTLLN